MTSMHTMPAYEQHVDAPTGGNLQPVQTLASSMVSGADFILDAPTDVPAVWGNGDEVLWAEGESLILAGPAGVGKTTLVGQLVRALIAGDTQVLGYDVKPAQGKVLYLAMDRPRQIGRSLHRHFDENDRPALTGSLLIWSGPPPADLAKCPDLLANMGKEAGASHIIIDSLKDAAIGLSEDDTGAGYNRARQKALAAGIEIIELHHTVKRGPNGAPPNNLEGLYGSTWITAGAGSVILLWGQAGDSIVELTHLKQPADSVGPFKVLHDHAKGTSTVWESTDPWQMMIAAGDKGITANELATALFDSQKPTSNEIEKARRRLNALVNEERAEVFERPQTGVGGKPPKVYRAITGAITPPDSSTPTTDSSANHDYNAVPHDSAAEAITDSTTPITSPSNHVFPPSYKEGETYAQSGHGRETQCTDCGQPFTGAAEMSRCQNNHQYLKDGSPNPEWTPRQTLGPSS